MSLVVIEDLSISFGARSIVDGLSLRIGEADRIGLIGRNGSGKSTLLRVIAGTGEADAGSVRTSRGLRIGYLAQELVVAGGVGLLDKVLSSVPGRAELEASLAATEGELDSAEDDAAQMASAQRLADLHEELLHFDTHFSEHEAARILSGLGFKANDFGRRIEEFSGGWKMRAELASLLFQQPDLLMLDEPTNHLDVPSVAWLNGFLQRFHGATVLICHDREFLNRHVNRIVAYEPEGVRQYSGDYETYKKARAEEVDILVRRAKNLAREREQAERFIRRFRAQATKARAVQSRIKQLEKMDKATVLEQESSLHFRFRPCNRAGTTVLTLAGIGHRYGELRVLDDVTLAVRRGERIAIVGANGAGKSTLLKIMGEKLTPAEGKVTVGYNSRVGYYAQHVADDLPLGSSILDEVWRSSKIDDVSQTRSVLGTFFFSGDDVDKVIGVLSGGEKARVALAKLIVNPGNVMLMDEPTNHLDLESSEALAEALATFDGTLVFVSHNQSFVNRLATRIWNVHDNRVEEYFGNLAEYMAHCEELAGGTEADVVESTVDGVHRTDGKAQRPERAKKGNRPRAEAARINPVVAKRKIAEYEARIGELEKMQAERSRELSQPQTYADQSRYHDILSSYTRDQRKLEELMARWERACAGIESI